MFVAGPKMMPVVFTDRGFEGNVVVVMGTVVRECDGKDFSY